MSKENRPKRTGIPASSSVFVTRFSQLVLERRFAEAGRVLQRLTEKMKRNEWNRGYLQALNGILLTQKSSDERYAFLANLDLDDEKTIRKHRRDFLNQIKSEFHAEYDRGFFSAWSDFLRVILKLKKKTKGQAEAGD
ncbi:MAG: hypothetical protein ACE5NN_02120 [Candidatus Bathyarchaeia archaeon]